MSNNCGFQPSVVSSTTDDTDVDMLKRVASPAVSLATEDTDVDMQDNRGLHVSVEPLGPTFGRELGNKGRRH